MLKFSVLLSLYIKENAEYFKSSLESIFCQTLLPNEVILVKDGPITEELEKIIADFKKRYKILKVIPLEKNIGLGLALNEGLKHCSYDIVARMDTDDIAKKDRFDKQIDIFRNNPEIDLVSAWIDEFTDDISNINSTRKLPENHKDILSFGKSRNPVNHPVVMFRKNKVMEAGSYKDFYLLEDYYL